MKGEYHFTALGLDVIPEDVTNQGRMDLTVRFKDYVFIIEFKLLQSNQTPGEALAQIKQKKYAEKYAASSKNIWLLGMEFDPVKRDISHFQWEKFQ
ncbi:MAG: hypothetical protein D3904_00225 [Candidatus Electrothrix sp. EH2]|nr:hypothetical protein [Candidatus Electrothrix sp. EH2]